MTNADKIRSMTDEELYKFICQNTCCQACPFYSYEYEYEGCYLKQWLSREVEEGDKRRWAE